MLYLDYNTNMDYSIRDNKIFIKIPATNDGKFRFKTRKHNLEFGEIFSTRKINFNNDAYLEWQIGYDATAKEIKDGAKKTILKQLKFVGANKKEKYPYELSELLYFAAKNGLIPINDLNSLLEEIKNYSNFISDRKISVEHQSKVIINGVHFEETSIKLPTLFMMETADNTQIEVSIQKQQYASGVKPMLYFCIPFNAFINHAELNGRPSNSNDALTYVIDNKNKNILLDMTKIFAMCSPRHNFDITEILKILLKLLQN